MCHIIKQVMIGLTKFQMKYSIIAIKKNMMMSFMHEK